MGKQTSTITMTGKLGNVVGYKMKGASGIRIKVDPKNPKTTSQMIQRMIFATATRAYSRMKEICDHSWEGVEIGTATQSEFIKRAIADLRERYALVADGASIDLLDEIAFSAKDDVGQVGIGLRISNGSIPGPALITEQTGTEVLAKGFRANIVYGGGTIAQVYEALGAEIGDQITIAEIVRRSERISFEYSRYVTRTDATDAELAVSFPSDDFGVLPAAFDPVRTRISTAYLSAITTGEDSAEHIEYVEPSNINGQVLGAAVIISRRGSKGVWLRSTALMHHMYPESVVYAPLAALSTWEDNGTSIEPLSDLYLNNADH